jgi:hypothetical protein
VLQRPPPAPRSLRSFAAEAALFAVVAAAALWPLPTAPATSVLLGTEDVVTVPFAMVWSFWWQADRIAHGLVDFWQAPIFHPTPSAFALSETNTLGGFVMAPVVLASGSAALGYNLFLWLALTLNGLVASALMQAWGVARSVAAVAGVAALMLPLPHQELGVLPLVPVFGILASLLALTHWGRAPGVKTAIALGASLAATYLLCFQYALFLALLLVALGWLLVPLRASLRPRPLATLVLAAALAGGTVAPVVDAQLNSVTEEAGFKRKTERVERLAARPRHFARTPWRQAIPGMSVARNPGAKAFFPGLTRVVLALIGLIWALGRPRTTRTGWFLAAGILGAYSMALGPHLVVGGVNVWEFMAEHVPGYGKVRSVNRWAVFFELFVVLLAGFGLQAVRDRIVGRAPEGPDGGLAPARGRSRTGWRLALVALSVVCMLEITPSRAQLAPVPDPAVHAGWGTWVREHTPTDAVLAFLPFAEGGNVTDYAQDAERMLLGGVHGRTMVNGYSSYFPRPFRSLKKALVDFPSEEALEALRQVGVTHLVVDERTYPEHVIGDYPVVREGLERAVRDERAGITIYALAPSEP